MPPTTLKGQQTTERFSPSADQEGSAKPLILVFHEAFLRLVIEFRSGSSQHWNQKCCVVLHSRAEATGERPKGPHCASICCRYPLCRACKGERVNDTILAQRRAQHAAFLVQHSLWPSPLSNRGQKESERKKKECSHECSGKRRVG